MKQLPSCSDYIISIETPQLIKAKELQGGCVVLKNSKPIRYAGGFCVVFPYNLISGKKVAVRCWTAYVPDAEKRSKQISQSLRESNLPYFVGFDYIENGVATALGVFPIVVMDWVDATPLKDYLKSHINNPASLQNLAQEFKHMVSELHKAGFSHGDLQHGNLMISQSGQIFLVDYDSMFVPGLEGMSDEIKGLAGYQHPGRNKIKDLSPKADYFSELIIYTSILALSKHPSLWNDLKIEDTETLVFTPEDLDAPSRSQTMRILKSDPDLSDCIEAIEDALNTSELDELLPLEEAIIPQSVRAVGGLQDKWKNPKYMQPAPEYGANVADLSAKWNKPQLEDSTNEPIDVSLIAKKWR